MTESSHGWNLQKIENESSFRHSVSDPWSNWLKYVQLLLIMLLERDSGKLLIGFLLLIATFHP